MSTAKELKKEIERGVWDASLGKLYGRRASRLFVRAETVTFRHFKIVR